MDGARSRFSNAGGTESRAFPWELGKSREPSLGCRELLSGTGCPSIANGVAMRTLPPPVKKEESRASRLFCDDGALSSRKRTAVA
jgi:hypothetical protein